MSINGKLLSPPYSALSLSLLLKHTHTPLHTHTLHSQMAWSRSFPLWMEDNWIYQSVVFCCSDRSVYAQKRQKHKQLINNVCVCVVRACADKSSRTFIRALEDPILVITLPLQCSNSGNS